MPEDADFDKLAKSQAFHERISHAIEVADGFKPEKMKSFLTDNARLMSFDSTDRKQLFDEAMAFHRKSVGLFHLDRRLQLQAGFSVRDDRGRPQRLEHHGIQWRRGVC